MRNLARICLRWPGSALAVVALASGLFASGLARLDTAVGYRAFLGPAHPAVVQLDAFAARFGGGVPLAAVFSCRESPCESVFDPDGRAHPRDGSGSPGTRTVPGRSAARPRRARQGRRRCSRGACDAIHLVSAYASRARAARPRNRTEREPLVLDACAEVGAACAVTTLTTGAGFASFAAGGLESLERFGLVAAFGVCAAPVLCFSLLPLLLARISAERFARPEVDRSWDRLRALLAQVREAVAARVPDDWKVTNTRPLQVVQVMIDEIRRTQLLSFASAAVVAAAIAALYFRSLASAALAMVPTLLPVVATLGLMGLAGIALDVGGAMVAAVVVGVAVDDAIHLLVQYRRRRDAGLAAGAALGDGIRRVGRALVATSLALATGFSSLALAPWHSIASFGLISAVAILAALASALLVLPALIQTLEAGTGTPWCTSPGHSCTR